MTDPLYLGLDLATAGARLTAVAADGTVHARLRDPLPPPVGGEQDPAYLAVARQLLRRLVTDLGPDATRIVALSVTGTSGTVVACDHRGRPVSPALMYDDTRATAEVGRLAAATDRPVPATSPLARMGWLQAHRPGEVYLSTPDVVVAGLTGAVRATDTSHALKAGIDPVAAKWDLGAAACLDVPVSALPDLVHPGTPLATLDRRVAADLGLPADLLVVAGMTDGCTAQIACGAVRLGDTLGVLGTTLVLKAVSAVAIDDGPVYSHFAPDGRYWPGGASNAGGGLVRSEFSGQDPDRLADAAAAAGPSSAVRYPLPSRGERFPVADRMFGGFLLGQDPTYRTLLEGVAFIERLGLETLVAVGVPSTRHLIAGGATASTVWNRIRATVLDRPVHRVTDAGSSHGAAILARVGETGVPLADVADTMTGPTATVHPDPTEREQLEDSYRRFVAELDRRGLLTHHPQPPHPARHPEEVR